jgi:lipoprotein NlpD
MKHWAYGAGWVVLALLASCGTQRPAPVVDRSGGATARTEKPAAATPARTQDGVYTVQRGDTLYNVASSFNVDARELARWNGIADTSVLTVGQALRVTPPPATATVTCRTFGHGRGLPAASRQ